VIDQMYIGELASDPVRALAWLAVFGFRPGTPEAKKFWQEHGEQL
jgi:hypothetical protein